MVTLTASPAFPVLQFVLDHKLAVFTGVGLLLGSNLYVVFRYIPSRDCAPGEACHVDSRSSRLGRAMLWTSVGLYTVSLAVTYLLLPVLMFFDM